MQYLAIGIHCLVGVVFLVSSVSKVARRGAFDAFVTSLRRMDLVPRNATRPVAVGVVTAEFAVWALLVTTVDAAAQAGLVVAAGLLVLFGIGIALTVRRGVRASCRCFGASAVPLRPGHIVRNGALAAIAVVGAVTTPAAGPVSAGELAVTAIGGLMLGGLVLVLDDIVDLFLPLQGVLHDDRPDRGPGTRGVARRAESGAYAGRDQAPS